VSDPPNPDDPVGWFTAAIEYAQNQDYPNALRCYQKATALNPDFIDAWGRMGLLLVKLGRFDEAHVCDARVRELNMRISGENRRLSEAAETSRPPGWNPAPPKLRKNIWAAGAASAICPGLGQVYTSGEYRKGWLILAALFLFALAGTFLDNFKGIYWLSPLAPYLSALPRLAILLPILVWLYSIIQAIWIASEINNNRVLFVGIRISRSFGYVMITYFVAALLFLYFPMVSTGLAGFWMPGVY
jgi:tetratricopeptide (TPR) repeat protein